MEPRLRTALMVYAFATLGLFLLVVPWTPVWSQAVQSLLPRGLARAALSGWARGSVSGIGAVDIAVALRSGIELWHSIRD